jgi:hypothetical protein
LYIGINLISFKVKDTLAKWNQMFRFNGEKFPHPNVYAANGLKPKPDIFELYPKAVLDVKEYVLRHLDHFRVEMLCEEFATTTTIIPQLIEEAKVAAFPIDDNGLLKYYTDHPPSYRTV